MVKILQAYNFTKQNTYALSGEILAATLIDSNRIAISSAEQFIEIYDIGDQQQQQHAEPAVDANAQQRVPAKNSLATVGDVVNLIYCKGGKYLLTLEKESPSSPVHSNSTSISCTSSSNTSTYSDDETKMFVRIYANFWKFDDAKLINLPITIRIASMTTPKAPLVESIDVIELPLRSPPDLIQCCQASGNIIVSSKDRIYLYEYTQCTHENTQPRFSYVDFLPFKFFVNLNFVPLKMCLAENVIACMNNRYCVAFKIIDVLNASECGGAAQTLNIDNDDFYGAGIRVGDGKGDELNNSSEASNVSKGSAGPSSHNSFEMDSLDTTLSGRYCCGVPDFGRTPVDFNLARIVNSVSGRDFEYPLTSQWEQKNSCVGVGDTQEIIILPTRASDIKIKLVNEAKAMNVQRISTGNNMAACYKDDNNVQYDIRKLLQICMKTSEPGARVVDILRCIDLKAIYQRNANLDADVDDSEYDSGNQQIPSAVSTTKHINRRTLKSSRHNSCIGYALLVASSVDGYLYQFCAQGKWYNENEKPVATYAFTAPVLKVHINDYVIYAITSESVETHTSRIGHKLFNNRFEYPTIAGIFPEESSPDVNAAISVVGLCSFMHVQFVCVNSENLVLITNSTLGNQLEAQAAKRRSGSAGSESKRNNIASRLIAEAKAKHNLLRSNAAQQSVVNEWTLYNLELPQVEHVIEDLDNIAETYRVASSTNFYELMEEAHVMLRLSLSLQCEQLSAAREQKLRSKLMNNCRKLADFSIASRKKEIYLQATGFYKMCNLQLPDIYNSYIANGLQDAETELLKTHTCSHYEPPKMDAEQLVGFIYAVKLFLLGLGTDRAKAAFLNQLVRPYFTPNRVIDRGFLQVSLSLELLNLFIKYSPADIPQIMLSSPVVADAISGELINYLKYLDKLNPEENLVFAVTACRMSNYVLSQELVAKSCRRSLAVALIKYKNVLFDDGTILFQKQQQQRADGKTQNSPLHVESLPLKSNHRKQQQNKSNLEHAAASTQEHRSVISFSEFTETILLATENDDLIEAVSDAFIHALCIEHSITLEMIIQLFLNYIASHIGHKGYQTSHKVFANILQVYYYDLFDVSALSNPKDLCSNNTQPANDEDCDEASLKAPSLNSEKDSLADTNSNVSSSLDERCTQQQTQRQNRIIYDELQEQQRLSPTKRSSTNALPEQHDPLNGHSNELDCEANLKGLKILFRMYLGRLKSLSDLITDLQSADLEQQSINEEFLNLRMECIAFMIRHLQEMRTQQQQQHSRAGGSDASSQFYYHTKTSINNGNDEHKSMFVPFVPDYNLANEAYERHIKAYKRPIPCLMERPQFLNRLPPFQRADFSYPNNDEGVNEVHFMGWHNELLTLTLKIQSLLSSPKIDCAIIEEFIAFVQKTHNLIGIDSFLVIVLPKNLSINYMLNFSPENLWYYGKSNGFTPKHWESLLRKLFNKQDVLPNWKSHITDILNNLVMELSFEELLQCFPNEVIQSSHSKAYLNELTDNCVGYENDKLVYSKAACDGDKHAISRNHLPMDNIDENNVFELVLRKAVSKQRSTALRSMIESTGTQLFDATSNPMYNL